MTLHRRLEVHIKDHKGLTLSDRSRYPWEYTRHNASRMLVLKALSRTVDIRVQTIGEFTCLISNVDRFVEVPKKGPKLAGSYLSRDKKRNVWNRSGKAVWIQNRVYKGHEQARKKLPALPGCTNTTV